MYEISLYYSISQLFGSLRTSIYFFSQRSPIFLLQWFKFLLIYLLKRFNKSVYLINSPSIDDFFVINKPLFKIRYKFEGWNDVLIKLQLMKFILIQWYLYITKPGMTWIHMLINLALSTFVLTGKIYCQTTLLCASMTSVVIYWELFKCFNCVGYTSIVIR